MFQLLLVITLLNVSVTHQDPIIGVWKGTSICQIKSSPCHDEIVVYHISKGEKNNEYIIQANKIVNGVEEDMGLLHCVWNEKLQQLTSNEYNSLWTFTLHGDTFDGTLMHKDALYRIVKVTKEN